MKSTIKKGKEGEKLAAEYLEQQGYEVLEQNYRHRRGEIDLIARKNKLLVFVEVKARSSSNYGHPEASVSRQKEEMVMNTAENYLVEKQWQGPIRFDIISISFSKGSIPEISHFEDAFY